MKELNIKIDVDTKQATKAMDDLAESTYDVSASFEKVYGDIQPLTARMGEAEDRLYELANAGKTTTKEYQDLLETVGNYRKVQIQTDMAVDAAASTMAQKMGGAIGGVTAGFSIAQGAMGAFGVESENLEKQLLKVQSALAISEGVRGFKEAIPSIKAFGTALKSAIGASGIGLLVVALGTLAAYWDNIKAAVGGVSAEQDKLNAKTDANVAAQQAKYDTISGQDNILKLQGKSERDILKIKQSQINAVIKATEAQLVQQEATKDAQVKAAKRNRDILEGIIKFLTAPLQLVLKTVDAVGSALGKDFGLQKGFNRGISSFVFDPKSVEEEGNKTIQATKDKLAALKNEAAGFTLAIREMDKPAEKVVSKSADKVVEEAKKEVSILQDMEVEKIGIRKATLDKTLEFQKLENDGLKQGLDLKLQIAQTERELHKQKIADMNEALEATSATLGQVADLFGRESAAGKAAAIAQATIDTYLSAQKAYTSTIGIPIVGPILAPISAGVAIAAGIKNIKAITAVKTPNGGGR